MKCKAKDCPEDDLDDEKVFCQLHWDLLGPGGYQVQLCDAYGTILWKRALASTTKILNLMLTQQKKTEDR